MLGQVKAWLLAIGAALVSGLAAWGMYNKRKAEKLEDRALVAEAIVHADKVIKKIKKEKKKELSRKESELKKEIKNAKTPEDLDNLFDNDGW